MASLYHPFDTDHLYEYTEDGNIRVTVGERQGLFTTQGIHISGEFKHADPQICVWVAITLMRQRNCPDHVWLVGKFSR